MRPGTGRAGAVSLVLLGAAALAAAFYARRLVFDHDARSLLRADPAAEAAAAALEASFGSEDLLLLAWRIPPPLSEDSYRRLEAITRELAATPGLEDVYSLASPAVPVPLEVLRPLRAEDFSVENLPRTRRALLETGARDLYAGTLYDEDLEVFAVAGTVAPAPRAAREEAVRAARAIALRHERPGSPVHVAGVTAVAMDATEHAIEDLERVGAAALAVSLGALFVLCGDWRRALAAAAATGLPPLYALGWAGAYGISVSALGAALFPVLAVVGISGGVHVIHAFDEAWRSGAPPRAAADRAVRRTGAPVLLALLTTAAAFFSLEATGVPAFREGGRLVGAGVLAAAPALLLGLPAALARLPLSPPRPPSRRAGRTLLAVATGAIRRRGAVLAAAAALALAGALLASRARVSVDVLQAFRPSSRAARTYRFLEEELTATLPADVVLVARGGASEADVLADLARFELEAEALPGVDDAMSLARIVRAGASAMGLADAPPSLVLPVLHAAFGDIVSRFRDAPAGRYRVKLRLHEGAPASTLEAIRLAAARMKTGTTELTGLYVRAVDTARRLRADVARGVALMTALCVGAVGLALRSWRLAAASILPNVLPPALVLGGAAAAGAPLDVSSAAVAAVAVGLAVDGVFHVLFRVARERRAGRSARSAVRRAQRSVGRALVVGVSVLALGLSCLALSAFLPTARFGLYTAAACAVALFADLVLLPAGVAAAARE